MPKKAIRRVRNHVSKTARRPVGGNGCRAVVDLLEHRLLFSTYTVNTTSASLNPGAGLLSLPEAVADANAHAGSDTINFSSSVFPGSGTHTITLTGAQLNLTDTSGTTTIDGPGQFALTVSGGSKSRVFSIASKVTAIIENMSIAKGLAPASASGFTQGGGVYNAGSLTLTDSIVTGNTANSTGTNIYDTAQGGGIWSSGPLSVQGTTVTSNTAKGYGQEVSAYGGGIYATGSLTISSSNVSSNTVSGAPFAGPGNYNGGNGQGGGIDAGGPLNVTSSSISDNTALGGVGNSDDVSSETGGDGTGGGIASFSTSPSATIYNSTVSGNTAVGGYAAYGSNGEGNGGGILADGSLILSGDSITDNKAQSGAAQVGFNFPARGGGIDNLGTLTIKQSSVSGNTALGGDGNYSTQPGSYAAGGGIETGGNLTVSQSVIAGNTAQGGAGTDGQGGPTTKSGNGGAAFGGGIHIQAGTTTLTDTTVANNKAVGGAGGAALEGSPTNGGNGGNGDGGGINTASTLKAYDSTISGNTTAAGPGGAGYKAEAGGTSRAAGKAGVAGAAGIFIASGTTTLDNTIVSANKAAAAFLDISGSVSSSSEYNLIGIGGGLTNGVHGNKIGITNPMLSSLAVNGGPTQNMVPLAGSPAIDAGSNALIPSGLTTDQRGYARIFNTTVDIGADEYSVITITGIVFNDVNGDGVRQTGEGVMSNVQVFIDIGDKGLFETGDPFAMTNTSGAYTLVYAPVYAPPIGQTSLIVRETRPTNYRRTDPAGIYPLGIYTIATNKASVPNINFGNSLTALVTGTVFHDTNGNGVQDSGEAGLSGWVVEVDAEISGVWHDDKYSATTSSTGSYSIVLAAGTYRFHDVLKSGLHPTIPSTGIITLTLASGATDTGENFGNK